MQERRFSKVCIVYLWRRSFALVKNMHLSERSELCIFLAAFSKRPPPLENKQTCDMSRPCIVPSPCQHHRDFIIHAQKHNPAWKRGVNKGDNENLYVMQLPNIGAAGFLVFIGKLL